MGELHQFNWSRDLSDWDKPTTLSEELSRWDRLFHHTENESWKQTAHVLYERLAETLPSNVQMGLVHGDLQPGNLLVGGPGEVSLIDWDLAAIAPLGTDVGWLLMMSEREAWPSDWAPAQPISHADLLETYWHKGGPVTENLDWYQAFSQFKMASITGLNLKLHRSGRRHDPIWEKFAHAVPIQLNHAMQLASKLTPSQEI